MIRDIRYGTYGKLEHDFWEGATPNFRTAQVGYGIEGQPATGSDYLIFGKLDNNDFALGPYFGRTQSEIAQDWMVLRTQPHKSENLNELEFFWELLQIAADYLLGSLYDADTEIQAEIGEAVYFGAISRMRGKGDRPFSSTLFFMREFLEDLFVKESTPQTGYISPINSAVVSPIRFSLEKKIQDMDSDSPGAIHIIYVEIGNEPNHFPAIPPQLYGEYYGKYWDYIQAQIVAMGRAGNVIVKVMPGGLMIHDGLPKKLLAYLDQGPKIDIPVGDNSRNRIRLNARIYTNAYEYWKSFAGVVNRQTKEPSGSHSYLTWVKKKTWFGKISVPVIRERTEYRKIGLKTRIDVVNLHFYPHAGPYAEDVEFPADGKNIPSYPGDMLSKFLPVSSVNSAFSFTDQNLSPKYNFQDASYNWNVIKSQLALLRCYAVLIAKWIKPWAGYPNNREVWLTEVGSLNPATSSYQAARMVEPVFSVLNAGYLQYYDDSTSTKPTFLNTAPLFQQFTRWYWYKNSGSDVNFNLLNTTPALDDKGLLANIHQRLGLKNEAGHSKRDDLKAAGAIFNNPISPELDAIITPMLLAWVMLPPSTALESEDADHILTPIGLTYLKKGGYDPEVIIIEGVGGGNTFTETIDTESKFNETVFF